MVILKSVPRIPWWFSGKKSTCQCRRHRFDPWSGNIPHTSEQPALQSKLHYNYWACALELGSHNSWTQAPQLLKPLPRATAPQQEKPPPQWEACSLQLESSPHSPEWDKSSHSNKDPSETEINIRDRNKVKKNVPGKAKWELGVEILNSGPYLNVSTLGFRRAVIL